MILESSSTRRRGRALHDVFLSYNSKDLSQAQQIVHGLERRGVSVFWDRVYLKIGRPWIPALEEAIGSVKAVIALVGPDGLGRWQRREVDAALDRQAGEPEFSVIPVLLPRARPLPRFLALNTWVDLHQGVSDIRAMELLAAGILGETLSMDQVTLRSDAIRDMVCPYRGLAAFREDDADFFFGRETVVDQLVAALDKSRFVALYGSSGSGKSSVVHAGLIPRLRRTKSEEIWDFAFTRPTDKPLAALAAALFPLVEPDKMRLDKVRGIKELAVDLATEKVDLADLIVTGRERLTSTGRLLLVVDQWEELYTLCREPQVRARFLAQLRDAIQKDLLSVVCTVREDFVARASDEESLGESFERSKVHLRRMHFDELQAAIKIPAQKIGLAFEEGLTERILDDLGDEPGQLPLLEFVLTELWKRRSNGKLRHDSYDELGGGRKAIATRAEEIFNTLSPGDQEEVRRLFLLLVRPGEGTQDTRRRAALTEIGEVGQKVMDPLVDARLLTTSLVPDDSDDSESLDELDPDAGTVEITHEALISHWDRLRNWLAKDRDFLLWRERLRLSRSTWEHEGREEGFLLTRAPLAEAEEWIETRRRDLTKAEEEFIARSLDRHYEEMRKEAEEQRREMEEEAARQKRELEREIERERQELARKERKRRKRTKALLAFSALLLGIALLGFWYSRHSLSRALAAEAIGLQEGPLDLALLLSLQADKTTDTLEARDSLLTALESSPSLKAFLPGHRGRVSRVAFSPDGRTIASGGSGDIFLWDGETGGRIGPPLQGHQGAIIGLAFSPDGGILASSGADGTIRLWNTADHKPLKPPLPVGPAVRNLVISPDGRLAAAIRDTTIYLWDFPSLQRRGEIPQAAWISDLAFDRNGHLASASADGTIALWDVAQRSKILTFKGHTQQALGLAFHPTQDILASAGADQKVRLWNVVTGEELGAPPDGHRDAVVSVAFSRDGRTLASAGRDKTVLLWNVESGRWDLTNSRPAGTLVGHGQTVWTLAFGEGRHLVSGGDDDAAILWHLQAEPRFSRSLAGLEGEADSVAFNRKGELLAIGGTDGTIRLWDTVAGKPRGAALQEHQGAVNGLIFQEGTLLSGGADGRILIWDLDHPETRPRELNSPEGKAVAGGVWSLALSPNGKILAAGDNQGEVRLWSLDPEKFLGPTSESHQGTVYGLAFSPDGSRLASGGQDIRLWDVQTRKRVMPPLKGHEDTVSGLAFSPDGQILASSSVDRTVRLWNPRTGKPRRGSPLTGSEASLTGVAFDGKGKILAASSLDGSILLWDVESLHPIGRGLRGVGEAYSLAFHPAGESLVSGNRVSVRLFDLRYKTWRSEACRTVGRNMTLGEWRKYLGWEPYRETCPENSSSLKALANRLDKALRVTK
jgi:WD40 repeat protein